MMKKLLRCFLVLALAAPVCMIVAQQEQGEEEEEEKEETEPPFAILFPCGLPKPSVWLTFFS